MSQKSWKLGVGNWKLEEKGWQSRFPITVGGIHFLQLLLKSIDQYFWGF